MARTGQRDGEREGRWRELVASWKQSGQSIRAFCRQHGVSEANFYAWRRTLAERDGERALTRRPKPSFVPVRVVAEAVVEVVVGDITLRLPLSCEAAAVAAWVSALRSSPC